MPRKKKVEPQIKMRADGRYQVSVDCGRDFEGRRQRKVFYGKTPEEAQAKADKAKAEISCGLFKYEKSMTFNNFATKWLLSKKGTIENQTLATYKSALSNHVLPIIGSVRMEDVKYQHIQKILNNMAAAGLVKTTISGVKTICSGIFNDAIKAEIIERNPATLADMPNKCERSAGREALSEEQIAAITEHWQVAPQIGITALVMIFAGLRPSEMLALNWNDFDLQNGTVKVSKTMAHSCKPSLKPPKTESSNRTVNLPDALTEILKEEKKGAESTLFCPSRANNYRGYQSYLGCFKRFISLVAKASKVDFEGVTPYCCRHTYATIAYTAGCSANATMAQMGHSDIKITLGTYTHISRTAKTKDDQKYNDACNQFFAIGSQG